MPSPLRATVLGFLAVIMWSTMATMVSAISGLPVFQLLILAYTGAWAVVISTWAIRGELTPAKFQMPGKLWCLGIASIFSFHVSYYIGMREAPPVDVLLIINFWPLMMVLFSALADKQRLHWWHMVGVISGFTGIAIITSHKGPFTFSPEYFIGYASAFCCAVIWAAYSVIARKNSHLLPKDASSVFCLACLPLALMLHWLLEPAFTDITLIQLALAVAVGAFPMGLAYMLWDTGVRQGDIRTLGTISYLGPLIGTTLLILFGFADFSFKIILAAALIIGGAFIGSMGMWRKKKV